MASWLSKPLSLKNGAALVDGCPRLLISADYPYYRDDPTNWAERLSSLKSLGIAVVSAYIPWRHHQPNPGADPDFTGRSQPNRDAIGFFRLCGELDLAVIAKPGPFIHAETNYGGLPDWVCPLIQTRIEPLLDARGETVNWMGARLDSSGTSAERWPLPAPFDAQFMRLTRDWLSSAGREVIGPLSSPKGPVIALQIANEGIYSNGQHAPWAYDYSASGLSRYRKFLRQKYGSLKNLSQAWGIEASKWEEVPAARVWQAPAKPAGWQPTLDWGEFQAQYMYEIFSAWIEPLETRLPVLVNQNPPLDETFGLDAWLTRVEPERWTCVHYGFTNWVGDVSARPSAFDRYLLTAKRFPGINLEENWGFAALYDPAYIDAATSFYQTLAVLNAGATGFNVYTGVATAFHDLNMEVLPRVPYPDAAPITETGALTPKAEIVRWMAEFFEKYGGEFLACQPVQAAAWGLYLPHARAAAWVPAGADIQPALGRHLAEFQRQMRALGQDYGLVNLESASLEELLRWPILVVSGGLFMAMQVQEKLSAYASTGKLVLVGDVPVLDEHFKPCTLLTQARGKLTTTQHVQADAWLPGPHPQAQAGADVWVRSHPERDLHFVTVLIPAEGETHLTISIHLGNADLALELRACRSGGAVLRVENQQISAALIKGHNGFLHSSVVPRVSLGNQVVEAPGPGDLALIAGQTRYLVKA